MAAILEDERGLMPPEAEQYVEAAFRAALENEGVQNACATVMTVDNEEIRLLNKRMRGVDSVTDVLSFPNLRYADGALLRDHPSLLKRAYDPSLRAHYLGDIAINIDRARLQAEEYGHSVNREICYLCVHALLHLCGYDHMTDADKALMRMREEEIMAKIGLVRE